MTRFQFTHPGVKAIYLVTTLFLVGLSVFIYSLINQLVDTAYVINENTKVSLELDRMMDNLRDAQSAQRDYLATHDSIHIVTLNKSLAEYPIHLKKVDSLISDSDFKIHQFDKIRRLAIKREKYFLRIQALDKVRPITIEDTRLGSLAADTLRFEVKTFKVLDNTIVKQRDRLLEYHSTYTPFVFLVLTLIALVLLLYFYLQINKSLQRTNQLQNAMKNLVIDSSVAVCVFEGADHIVTIVNKQYLALIQKTNIIGLSVGESTPSRGGFEHYVQSVQKVYTTGLNIEEREKKVLEKEEGSGSVNYYNYSFRPYHGAQGEIQGVIFQAVDVTEQVMSRSKIEENEKQLSIAIAAGELGTFDFFAESNKMLWSQKTKELFGLNPAEEVTYEKYNSILHQEDKSTMQRVLSAINENAGSYDIEYRINFKGEQIRWIRSKGIAHFNELGKPIRFTGVVQDITQRKESEAALKESEYHFRLLAETLPQLVWMTDEKGINKYTSHRWEEYTGVIPHSEKEWAAVVHPDDLAEINAVWMHCLASGDAYKHDVRLKMKSGKFRWFKVNAIPIKNSNNEIENWVGAFTDVHNEKEFTQELEENVRQRTFEINSKNEELKKINAELESLTYIASHDLQEPVRKIMVFTNLLLEKEVGNLSEQGKYNFEKIHRSTERIKKLIEDILAFSQISVKEQVFERVELADLIAQVKMELSDAIAAKKASVILSSSRTINIIQGQFLQLFINLVGNSLKFSKPDVSPVVTIDIAELASKEFASNIHLPATISKSIVESGTNYYHISVTDNGIGFDPAYSEQIFKMFAKLHNKNEFAGTGIGLAFVKKIIDNHHGYIYATSEQGNGCRFDIYIPAL